MKLTITELYEKMHQNMGDSGWWPAESKAEIIVGAIMIQNTNWRNADKAVAGFWKQTNFDPNQIRQLTTEELQALVRPAGFYRNKSQAVEAVFSWLSQYNDDYHQVSQDLGATLRKELLKLHGVGDETADVLLTYVFEQPTFISDKYARVLFTQLGVPHLTSYQSLARKVKLPANFTSTAAQDFHGLIDEFGKTYFHPLTKFQESFLAGDQLIL
ncbi:deoxyribonuclease I [Limosilactobacillus urinaemulieris]|uniref:endonuclease III domain-containing protein n=1 Tax=Limosilactobacillus urinaemulieris TaxID=2742600 RepID=UPI0028E402FF|nr:deoxyribonuclease I [Limosilactobacillus urinaemulieris]